MDPNGAKRVLIVDEHADVADSLAVILRNMGHEVLVAGDVDSALQTFRASLPHIVLLDVGIQRDAGYELARQMRQILGSTVKIYALTGHGLKGDHEESRRAGLDRHLVKPVDPDALRMVLT
jgi:DNA-binding response OmpR family regulator